MKKAEDYRRHADECRALARNATSDDERRQLIHMAETWLGLAQQRLQMLSANAIETVRVTEKERSAVQADADPASV